MVVRSELDRFAVYLPALPQQAAQGLAVHYEVVMQRYETHVASLPHPRAFGCHEAEAGNNMQGISAWMLQPGIPSTSMPLPGSRLLGFSERV